MCGVVCVCGVCEGSFVKTKELEITSEDQRINKWYLITTSK